MARSHLRRARGGRSSAALAEQRALPGARAKPPRRPGSRLAARGFPGGWSRRRGPPPALGGRGDGAGRVAARFLSSMWARGPRLFFAPRGCCRPGSPVPLQPPPTASGEPWGIIPPSPSGGWESKVLAPAAGSLESTGGCAPGAPWRCLPFGAGVNNPNVAVEQLEMKNGTFPTLERVDERGKTACRSAFKRKKLFREEMLLFSRS